MAMAASGSGGDLINNRSNGPGDLMEFEPSDTTHRKGNNDKDFNKRRAPDNYDSESQLKKFNAGQQQQQQIQQQHSTEETPYNTGKNEMTNSNSNNNTPLVPIVYYRENIPGPYSVWVRSTVSNKEVSQFKIGSLVYRKYDSIKNICRRSRSKVEIIVTSRTQANTLANDTSFKKHDLETYVPGFRRTRKGVIKGIDLEFSDEDILDGITCSGPMKVMEVRRMSRKNKQHSTQDVNDSKWIPTKSIVCTIEGQKLPEHVYIFGVRVKVEPYVQKVMQCYNCLKYRHTAKTCRGKSRCFNCGDLKHEGACAHTAPRCANCSQEGLSDTNHKSIDSSCPIFIAHKKINNIMAYDNVTFAEAKDAVFPNKSAPPTRSLTGKSAEQYPPLNKESNYSDFNKINSLENKTTTKIRSSNNQVSNQSPSGKQAILSHPTTSNNNSNNNNNGNSNSNKNRTGKSTLTTNNPEGQDGNFNTNLASTTKKLYNRLHQEQLNNINGSTRDPLFDFCNPPT
ncbi:mediator of RNA polymerase II transcription subunit 13-like [Trichogramma pretiosum]|uniref:mediator of RNA polymerase II transcription subunit 13-like n=1 Tax=Trichogramma pretiosum TaxID=7493 RepID=UPI000C718EDB|nr:mediator of RNA polymerase II transcription subunit 13-like [Trichogramma pretiosum]